VLPVVKFEISPEVAFIVAPSPGAGLKVKVPPAVAIFVGPFVETTSQKLLNVKLASSTGNTSTST